MFAKTAIPQIPHVFLENRKKCLIIM